VAALRNALGDKDFDSAWAEGRALSVEEAIAYAQRGRGESGVAAAVRARALADEATLGIRVGAADSLDQAQQALAMAREVDDPALLARALTACGSIAGYSSNAELARACFTEATELARAIGDRWRLSQILAFQAPAALVAGDPLDAVRASAEEGRDLAEAIGDRFVSRGCRWCLGVAQLYQGDLAGAAAQFAELVAEAQAAHDGVIEANSLLNQGLVLAYQGDTGAARAAADAAVEAAAELGGSPAGLGYLALATAALAAGDVATARDACEAGQQLSALPQTTATWRVFNAQAALAGGNLIAARRWADDAVTTASGSYLVVSLTTRAQVEIAQGEPEQAERDAQDALACASDFEAYLGISDALECLAAVAGGTGSHREAARLLGAAEAIRQRTGVLRFKIWDAGYEASVVALRDAMGEQDFDAGWAEGAALSTEEAIAYAQRGRGERKRPTSGWASLTPAERDVVRLVSEGLANNDIATRLFVSPRTVQTHLTHVYTKLGLSSRVQLAQEAARHA
jgi:DNA-binding CsgD family transcriptional regulator